jgi:diguanylate cyclase (GGDEF)-like protein
VLTGLANGRTLHEARRRELARAERHGGRLSVILANLDHFKSINDQHGHMTGDRVLATAAAIFGSQLCPYDLAARYGREEFVLLLPGASLNHAVAIADRIRKQIASLTVPGCPREITVSLGVAAWNTRIRGRMLSPALTPRCTSPRAMAETASKRPRPSAHNAASGGLTLSRLGIVKWPRACERADMPAWK